MRETVRGSPLEPGAQGLQRLATDRGLPLGAYVALATLQDALGVAEFPDRTFEIRHGAGSDSPQAPPLGRVGAFAPPAASVGRVAAFVVPFENEGSADIAAAKLTVEIFRDGERIEVVTSDSLRVPAGTTIDFEAFYQPRLPGAYTTRTYVTYDGVRTEATSADFAVAADAGAASVPIPAVISIVLAIAGAALIAGAGRKREG